MPEGIPGTSSGSAPLELGRDYFWAIHHVLASVTSGLPPTITRLTLLEFIDLKGTP